MGTKCVVATPKRWRRRRVALIERQRRRRGDGGGPGDGEREDDERARGARRREHGGASSFVTLGGWDGVRRARWGMATISTRARHRATRPTTMILASTRCAARREVETRERDRRSTPTVGGDDGERAATGRVSALALSGGPPGGGGTVSALRGSSTPRRERRVGFRGTFRIRAADR